MTTETTTDFAAGRDLHATRPLPAGRDLHATPPQPAGRDLHATPLPSAGPDLHATPPLPADRDLDAGELRSLVEWFAGRPDLWRAHVRHDANRRTFHRIVAEEHVTVWLICWMPGHDTGFHDHDGSAGAVAVVDGQIAEQRLRLLEPPKTAVYGARDVVDFGPAEIHRVRHFGTAPAVTVHAYSPVLMRMGAYVTGSDGRLLRHTLDEQTELRPQAAVLAPE